MSGSQLSRTAFAFILLALLAMAALLAPHWAAAKTLAQKGVLDLSGQDLDQLGQTSLDGEWEFYWQRFLLPGNRPTQATSYIQMPGSWNGFQHRGKAVGGKGFATYRLLVKLKRGHVPLALYITDLLSAGTVFINGRLVANFGWPAMEAAQEQPDKLPGLIRFTPEKPVLEILVQVSNHHHRLGGLVKSWTLGDQETMVAEISGRHDRTLFILGLAFMMGLYHLGLYLVRRQDQSPLYFGLFCLVIMFRVLSTGESFLYRLLPGMGWSWLMTVEYLSFFLAPPVFALYLHNLFPKAFHRKALVSILAVAFCFSLVGLFAPISVSSHLIPWYQIYTLVAGTYLIYVLIWVTIKKRPQAGLFLSAFLVLFVTAVHDILYAAEWINSTFLLHYGMVIFVMLQAYALAARHARAERDLRQKSGQLRKANLAYQGELVQRKRLEEDLLASNERIKDIRTATILGLAQLAEYRDHDTGTHLERIREFAKVLAAGLASRPKYQSYITPEYIDDLYQSAILHDIGKVGVPDAILLKPGKLTAEEFEVIKTHATLGGDAISELEARVEGQSFLTLGRKIAYFHHEKYDGSGYPKGLAGESIPLSARIVALADVYDALTTRRPYKEAFSHAVARGIILDGKGNHFDPEVVEVFLEMEEAFMRIKEQLADS